MMTIKEQFISEIKERIALQKDLLKREEDSARIEGSIDALQGLLNSMDSLESEKPIEGLEEEITRTYHDGSVTDTSDLDHNSYENIARHFAKWQKEQMLKEAMECELYYDGDFLAIDLNMAELGYSERDKVRVIILKED